jgi:GTP-binding protein
MKPVLALIGRPNVGKSTLFNRLTRSRLALVADEPGVTRDRQYGDGRVGDRPYFVVDTGGIADELRASDSALSGLVARQTRQAVAEADAILLITDVRAGLSAGDREIAAELRRTGKPIWLVVNKAEGMDAAVVTAEFHALGLGRPHAISSAHGEGVAALMSEVLAALPRCEETGVPGDVPRIAVVGRPNAGKSTLVNALLGEERVVVSAVAGTTRDAVQIPFERDRRRYVLIDTAGVRRRHRIDEQVEKHSVVRTLQAVDEANVVILVIDAATGMGEQDASLAGYVLERGRALVIAVNKWDALDREQREWVKREVERKLPFASFARVHYISARERTGVEALFRSCDEAFEASGMELPTSRLNRVLERAVAATPPPIVRGHRIRPKFAHQAGRFPPTIVVHGSLVSSLSAGYRRYLQNAFREAFRLVGTPVRIECRQQDNPYANRGTRAGRARRGGRGRTGSREKIKKNS